MKWLKTYKIHLLLVIAILAFLSTFVHYFNLVNENYKLKEQITILEEKNNLLDSYPYEHSKIENNDRVTDFPKHNDFGNCIEYRQCSCTCGDGKGVTKRPAKKGADLRYSRSIPF
jgi:hypothetical protein